MAMDIQNLTIVDSKLKNPFLKPEPTITYGFRTF